MEFERPEIFNKRDAEKRIDYDIEKRIEDIYDRLYRENIEIYRPTKLNNYSINNIDIPNINKDRSEYIGIKNIKLINEISCFLIKELYTYSFKKTRLESFIVLDKILIEFDKRINWVECFNSYKDEIYFNIHKRIESRYINYMFKMISINLEEKGKFNDI